MQFKVLAQRKPVDIDRKTLNVKVPCAPNGVISVKAVFVGPGVFISNR